MKILSTFLLAVLVGLCACTDKSSSPSPQETTFPSLLISGNWKISSFTENTEDKIKLLSNISIIFTQDGKATATQNNVTTQGTWIWGGNSYYGTPADSKTLTLNFGTSALYEQLSKTWIITDASKTVIDLDSNNPAENKHLVLSK